MLKGSKNIFIKIYFMEIKLYHWHEPHGLRISKIFKKNKTIYSYYVHGDIEAFKSFSL